MEFTGERFVPGFEMDDEIRVEHYQRYLSILDVVKGKIVVDVACGEGYGANLMMGSAKFVYGFDISEDAIKHAQETYSRKGLEFQVAGVNTLPAANKSIDVLVSFETIEHLDEVLQHKFLKEIKRVLKNDGLLVISTPNRAIYSDKYNYRNPFHVKEFYRDEFVAFLKDFFHTVHVYDQRFEVASVLDNRSSGTLRKVYEDGNSVEAKYLIAVCGSRESSMPASIGTVVPERGNKYFKLIDRVVQIQEEIESLSKWGLSQDEEISGKNQQILLKEQIIAQKDKVILRIDAQMIQKDESIDLLREQLQGLSESVRGKDLKIDELISSKLELSNRVDELVSIINQRDQLINKVQLEVQLMHAEVDSPASKLHDQEDSITENLEWVRAELQKKEQQILNHQGHIEQLLSKERDLNNIYASQGWRFLASFYRLRDLMFPGHKKLRVLLKTAFRMIRHPKRYMITREKISKFFMYMNIEESSVLENRVDTYLGRVGEKDVKQLQMFGNGEIMEIITFPRVEDPLVSIIIPVHNHFDSTYSCLRSIWQNTQNVKYEIIVGDDASTDETQTICDYAENIETIISEQNVGFLRNCNYAAEFAKGKYIVFLNNDTNVQSNWLTSLIETMENDPLVGLVGSKFVYSDGRLQEAGGIIWRDGSGWNYGRFDDPANPQYNYLKEVDYISGACIMIRAHLWADIGGFDERFAPAYYEDSDLAFEVRRRGHKVIYQPKSTVVHFEGISHGTDVSGGVKKTQSINQLKFREKWKDVLDREHFENGANVFHARDRSRGKRTIVVVDHYVPHFDQDAGSRTMYQYLRLFTDMGFNVKFVGDNFFKHEPYTSMLQSLGVEVLYGAHMQRSFKKWIREYAEYINFFYLLRPHIAEKYIDLVSGQENSKIIYNGTDFHYIREARQYRLSKNPEALISARRWREREFKLFAKCDIVFTISEYEKFLLSNKMPGKHVTVIPTFIYEDGFPLGTHRSFDERFSISFVGGFAHAPNVDGVLWFAEEVVPTLLRRIPNLVINIIGSNPPETIRRLQSKNVNVTGFVDDLELEKYYDETRVTIAPLRFGAGVKGKIIESIAHAIPVVTTKVGMEGITHAEDVVECASNAAEFVEKIISIYDNEIVWNEIRRRQTEYAERYLSTRYAESVLRRELT